MKSFATTVEEYLSLLNPDQRDIIIPLRAIIKENLPLGMEENLTWGMLSYEVPLTAYPTTYNGKPLLYVALAVQKNYYSLYLIPAYMNEQNKAKLEEAFRCAGKKLSMGKSCIRFKKLEDLPLSLIGEYIASFTLGSYIKACEQLRKNKT